MNIVSRFGWSLGILVVAASVLGTPAIGAQPGPDHRLSTRILRYMERAVEYTLLNPAAFNEQQGRFEPGWWPKVPSRARFMYAGAVCVTHPESKLYQNKELLRKLKSTLLYHAREVIAADTEQRLRGAWGGITKIDGPRDLWGWAVQNWWAASWLLFPHLTDAERQTVARAWDSWSRIASADGTEYYGCWLSTNKFSATANILACYLRKKQTPEVAPYAEKLLYWYWQAWPEEGMVDKRMGYYLHTLASVPHAMAVWPDWRSKALPKIEMLRSLVTPCGDLAWTGASRPDIQGSADIGTVAELLLAAAPDHPYLACLARRIIEERFPWPEPPPADWQTAIGCFYLGSGYDCPDAFIVQTASSWEPVLQKSEHTYEKLRFFDYWTGLGNLAVKTPVYQAVCFPHFGHCFDKQFYGAGVYQLCTAGTFRRTGGYRGCFEAVRKQGRLELPPARGKHWLFYQSGTRQGKVSRDDFQLNAYRGGMNVARPPAYPDHTWIAGDTHGALLGGVLCDYPAAGMKVRTVNFFLDDAIVCLHDYTVGQETSFDELFVALPFFDGGDAAAVSTPKRELKPSVGQPPAPVGEWVGFRPDEASHGLLLRRLSDSFEEATVEVLPPQEMDEADVRGSRVLYFKGKLPAKLAGGTRLLADYALLPHRLEQQPEAVAAKLVPIRQAAAHGVRLVRSDGSHVVAAVLDGRAKLGALEVEADAFCVVLKDDAVSEVCLLNGRELSYRGQTIVKLSHTASVGLDFADNAITGTIDGGTIVLRLSLPWKRAIPPVSYTGRLRGVEKQGDFLVLALLSDNPFWPRVANVRQSFHFPANQDKVAAGPAGAVDVAKFLKLPASIAALLATAPPAAEGATAQPQHTEVPAAALILEAEDKARSAFREVAALAALSAEQEQAEAVREATATVARLVGFARWHHSVPPPDGEPCLVRLQRSNSDLWPRELGLRLAAEILSCRREGAGQK